MTLTDISSDPAEDDLRLVGRDDSFFELGVVPSIDLAVSLDRRRVRVPVDKLVWQRSIRA